MDLGPEEIERRSFPVIRKGFDRSEVSLYLHRVAMAMADLEDAARAAELRVVELRRDVQELHGSSENGFHQAVASSSMAGQPGTGPRESEAFPSAREARRILAAATAQAARLKERAISIVESRRGPRRLAAHRAWRASPTQIYLRASRNPPDTPLRSRT